MLYISFEYFMSFLSFEVFLIESHMHIPHSLVSSLLLVNLSIIVLVQVIVWYQQQLDVPLLTLEQVLDQVLVHLHIRTLEISVVYTGKLVISFIFGFLIIIFSSLLFCLPTVNAHFRMICSVSWHQPKRLCKLLSLFYKGPGLTLPILSLILPILVIIIVLIFKGILLLVF